MLKESAYALLCDDYDAAKCPSQAKELLNISTLRKKRMSAGAQKAADGANWRFRPKTN